MIGIYRIISPTQRVYIGQSVRIEDRWDDYNKMRGTSSSSKLLRSFKKYGVENHIFEKVEECSIEQLNERERYWQDYYNVLDGGLNCKLTKTGDKSGRDSQETIDKRVIKLKKPILQYDLKGNFIQEWDSILKAKNTLKIVDISENLRGKQKQSGGFIWVYKLFEIPQLSIVVDLENNLKRTIVQYSKDKQFIKEWDFIKQAQDELGIGDLNSCLRGRTKTAGGFIWKYKEEQDNVNEINLDHRHNKLVIQYDLYGNIIDKFKSKTSAESKLGIKSLYYNLKTGKQNKGRIFKYDLDI